MSNNDSSDEWQKSLRQLATLPYLEGYNPAPQMDNVLVHEEELAYQGLNLFTSGHAPVAVLMDMKGNILHEWSIRFEDVWPEPLTFFEHEEHKKSFRWVHLYANGDLLAIFNGIGLVKLDKDSNLLWSYKGRCHHDLCVAENGNIYTITRRWIATHPGLDLKGPILEDCITILSPEGEEIKSVSLLDCFLNSDYSSALAFMKKKGEIFHTNTIEILDGSTSDKAPMFKKGRVLVSMRWTHTIAVVDLEDEKVVWALSGMFKDQHQPTLLENGNLLVFDNLGNHGMSKVIEFNPLTQEIVWAYRGDAENGFYSLHCGSTQRLPNGNTLITESNDGRVFEVTPENKIVWEFITPYRAGEHNELVANIPEMIRIDPNQISFLEESGRR